MQQAGKRNLYIGVSLAIVSVLIWSGNFVIARGISGIMPPFTTNFFRWATATLFLLPLALKKSMLEKEKVFQHSRYFLLLSFTCVLLFNSFVYIAGHHTTAINMALIGTTTSPVFTIVLAAIFLKEKVLPLRVLGLAFCIAGILVLLSRGSIETLLAFRFSQGDWWILAGSVFFAVYNLLVKQKPSSISPLTFLFVFCFTGTLMLLPFYLWEQAHTTAVAWTLQLAGIVLYLGFGASLVAYLCWNQAILLIGSSRTSLFGNLIPVFSTLEALLLLHEKIQPIHLVSGVLVITGLVIANSRRASVRMSA